MHWMSQVPSADADELVVFAALAIAHSLGLFPSHQTSL